jgi:hypothetical protein
MPSALLACLLACLLARMEIHQLISLQTKRQRSIRQAGRQAGKLKIQTNGARTTIVSHAMRGLTMRIGHHSPHALALHPDLSHGEAAGESLHPMGN